MRWLFLAALVAVSLVATACSHAECAIDTDCTLGKYCAMDTHSCQPLGGGDAGPRDAAPSDGAPRDAPMEAAVMDSGTDAGTDAGSDAGDIDADSDADVDLGP